MVRLVFRPYTQIWRSICTSESLRASTRVSSGFTLFRHSSPSFGSQHACSTAGPSQKVKTGRRCTPRQGSQLSLSLRAWVFHSNTCMYVRLLGPCFKTGRLKPLCQHPKCVCEVIPPDQSHTEFLNPNHCIQTRAITHLKMPHSQVLYPIIKIDADPSNKKYTRPKVKVDSEGYDWLQAFPFQQFHVLFNSLFKVLFIFPSRYLCAIGFSPIFSFRWNLPPIWSCIPKQLDSSRAHHKSASDLCQRRDCHPLWCPFPRDFCTGLSG